MATLSRQELEQSARDMAGAFDQALHRAHGQKVGFAIFLFGFGEGQNLAYISNAQRDDMIKTVREWLGRQEAGLQTDPSGPRAES